MFRNPLRRRWTVMCQFPGGRVAVTRRFWTETQAKKEAKSLQAIDYTFRGGRHYYIEEN